MRDHELKEELPRDPVEAHPFTMDFTTYYALQEPAIEAEDPPAILLLLHGWGQNCKGFLRTFAPLRQHNLLVIAAQAPHQFYVDPATKKVGFNWLTVYDRKQAIEDINRYLQRLLESIYSSHRCDSNRIMLLGFSQGVSVAWRFAVSGLLHPVGLVSCCADVPADVGEKLGQTQPFPVFLAYGRDDGMVGQPVQTAGKKTLSEHGFPYEEHIFEGGHEITPELLGLIGAWAEERGVRHSEGEPCSDKESKGA